MRELARRLPAQQRRPSHVRTLLLHQRSVHAQRLFMSPCFGFALFTALLLRNLLLDVCHASRRRWEQARMG